MSSVLLRTSLAPVKNLYFPPFRSPTSRIRIPPWAEMSRVCVLRRLGRCAGNTTTFPTTWSSRGATSLGQLRQNGRNGVHDASTTYTPKRFLTSSPSPRSPWKLTPPAPPSIHPSSATSTTSPLFERFRAVMRLLPHPVVVCTAKAPTDPAPRGMTMSSLTSLALHPTPLVTFNITTPSRTLDAITGARTFILHVLRGDPHGARVAEWFRRGNAEGLMVFDPAGLQEGCGCEVQADDGAPLLRGRGVLYALRCRLLEDEPLQGLVKVRDHVVVLAKVVEIVDGDGKDEEFGLAYADRRYRQMGATMVYEKDE